jgi:chromosome segregation ATPase
MPENNPTVPNSDPGVQTPPAPPSSAELRELEEYKARLAGAISTNDKIRNEITDLKARLQQVQTDYATQLQQKEVEFKSNLIQKETDLAAQINAKATLELEHEKIKKEYSASSAELARWGFINENPSL